MLQVTQLCYVYDALLSILDEVTAKAAQTEKDEDVLIESMTSREEILEAMYIQACYWSLGATLIAESRLEFDEYVKRTCGLMLVQDTVEKAATVRKYILRILSEFIEQLK